ncbi:hypothetical protein HDU96_006061 [Phlyctochytrium bullatum]|nr:hypothetical protein HDU96_006061 [Phlyctochytrium bullatum]
MPSQGLPSGLGDEIASGPFSGPLGAWRTFQLMAKYDSEDEFEDYWWPDPVEADDEVEDDHQVTPAETSVQAERPVKAMPHTPASRDNLAPTVAATEVEAEETASTEIAATNRDGKPSKTKKFRITFNFKTKAFTEPRASTASTIGPGEDKKPKKIKRGLKREDIKSLIAKTQKFFESLSCARGRDD